MRAVAVLMALTFGCATAPKPVVAPVVREAQRAEERPLPEDPDLAELPVDQGVDFKPVPVEAGECLPEGQDGPPEGVERPCPALSGILISERTAWKARLYQIRYKEMRKLYQSDRLLWGAHRELYEEKLNLSREELQRVHDEATPTWWEENDGTIGLISGLILGGVISIGIAAGINEAEK